MNCQLVASFDKSSVKLEFEQAYGLIFNFTDWTSDSDDCTQSLTYYISKDNKGQNPLETFTIETFLDEDDIPQYTIALDSSVVG